MPKGVSPGNSALGKVQKQFPQVEQVVDATDTILLTVSRKDVKGATKKDPNNCALARACKRQGADGAIIGIAYSYLIKGKTARRYRTSQTIAREITSFDRTRYFAQGENYRLSAVSKSSKLGKRSPHPGGRGVPKSSASQYVHHHKTSDIRVMKG